MQQNHYLFEYVACWDNCVERFDGLLINLLSTGTISTGTGTIDRVGAAPVRPCLLGNTFIPRYWYRYWYNDILYINISGRLVHHWPLYLKVSLRSLLVPFPPSSSYTPDTCPNALSNQVRRFCCRAKTLLCRFRKELYQHPQESFALLCGSNFFTKS